MTCWGSVLGADKHFEGVSALFCACTQCQAAGFTVGKVAGLQDQQKQNI